MDHLLYFVPFRQGMSLGRNTTKDQRADRALYDPGSGSTFLHVEDCLVQAEPTVRGSGHPSGLVAQLVEHRVCNAGASGSNPDESMGEIPPGPRKRVRQTNKSATDPTGSVVGTPRRA